MHRSEAWPDAISLDPSSGLASPAFEDLLREWSSTPVLLLAVGPQAQRDGWAAQAAVAIAEELSAAGSRVIIADLSLDNPELHNRLGLDNNEGLTDVFLFGASLEHVTLPAGSFELIPAAAFTPDAEEILTHRRWSILFEEYASASIRLLLYLPVTVDGSAAFSDRVGHTIVLANAEELDTVHAALSDDAEITAVLTPPVAEAEAAVSKTKAPPTVKREPPRVPARSPDDEFAKIRIPKDSAREALIADLRTRQRAAMMSPPPVKQPTGDEIDVAKSQPAPQQPRASMGFPPPRVGIHEPTFATRVRPKKKKKPGRLIVPLLAILVVSSAAAGWHYWGNQAWAGWRSRRVANQTDTQAQGQNGAAPAGTPVQPATPEGKPLPYSVAIGGYQVLDEANSRVAYLARSEPDMSFYVAPTIVQGAVFYRVFAGPLPDSAAAAAVRDTLLAKKIKTISVPSDLVSTRFAFLLGTFVRYGDADTKMREAAAKLIPAYIVPIGSATGWQFNLYVGAYAGQGDAEFMREILKQANLPDTLVERIGSIRS